MRREDETPGRPAGAEGEEGPDMRGSTGDMQGTDRGAPQGADEGQGGGPVTVDIYCDHPRHQRPAGTRTRAERERDAELGWQVATYVRRDTDDAARWSQGLLLADGHDEALCGGHPAGGCYRRQWWEFEGRPSSAVRHAARRRAEGRPTPEDGASRAAEAFLREPMHVAPGADGLTAWTAPDYRYQQSGDKYQSGPLVQTAAERTRDEAARSEGRDPYAGSRHMSRAEALAPSRMYEDTVRLRCEECADKVRNGSGGRVKTLTVHRSRLYELLDTVAEAGARRVPLAGLIRLNSPRQVSH